MVCFAPLDYDAERLDFWGRSFAIKAGYAALGFVAHRNNWYPAHHMAAAVAASAPTLSRFRSRVTYGSSMGAYAALKYGTLLKADASAAFGPQSTVDPSDPSASPSYYRFFNPFFHTDMMINGNDLSPRSYIFIDPRYKEDFVSAQTISATGPWATRIHIPHAGHECIKVFAGTQNMKEVIESCPAKDTDRLSEMARQLRATSPARAAGLTETLIDKHPSVALRIVEKHGPSFDHKQLAIFYSRLSKHYLRSNRPAEAEAYGLKAIELFPHRAVFFRDIGGVYHRIGRISEALLFYEKNLYLALYDWVVQDVVAEPHLSNGDLEKADHAASLALSAPQNLRASIRRCAAEIRKRQGRGQEAADFLSV